MYINIRIQEKVLHYELKSYDYILRDFLKRRNSRIATIHIASLCRDYVFKRYYGLIRYIIRKKQESSDGIDFFMLGMQFRRAVADVIVNSPFNHYVNEALC